MIRGSNSITAFFTNDIEIREIKNKKGIHSVERNRCLISRFYFYYHLLKMRFDTALAKIADEFFLSVRTVTDCIANNGDMLKAITLQNPDVKELRKAYPHFNWS